MGPLTRWQKATSALKALTSGRDKKLQDARDAVCEACPQLTKKPQRNKWSGAIELAKYCKKCGCGIGGLIANMRKGQKNAWRKAVCPLKLWPGDDHRLNGQKVLQLKEINWLSAAYDQLELDLATVQMHFDDGTMPDAVNKERLGGFPQQRYHLQQLLSDPVCMARYQEMQKEQKQAQEQAQEQAGTSNVKVSKGAPASAGAAVAREIPEGEFQENLKEATAGRRQ